MPLCRRESLLTKQHLRGPPSSHAALSSPHVTIARPPIFLLSLSPTTYQVSSLERSATAAAERDAQRRKLDILARLNTEAGLTGPALRDMERYVSELKRYLQVWGVDAGVGAGVPALLPSEHM
eukprot:364937-Chlamydomonas_euryale.AAC.29